MNAKERLRKKEAAPRVVALQVLLREKKQKSGGQEGGGQQRGFLAEGRPGKKQGEPDGGSGKERGKPKARLQQIDESANKDIKTAKPDGRWPAPDKPRIEEEKADV